MATNGQTMSFMGTSSRTTTLPRHGSGQHLKIKFRPRSTYSRADKCLTVMLARLIALPRGVREKIDFFGQGISVDN